MLAAVIALAHALADLGCDRAQGYLFAPAGAPGALLTVPHPARVASMPRTSPSSSARTVTST